MKPKSIGSKRTASVNGSSRSRARQVTRKAAVSFVLCLKNDGYEPTLQVGKAYRVLRPERGDPPYMLRVVDEEAEDYLYDADWFVPLVLPKKAHRALAARI